MGKCDILCLEWSTKNRDSNILMPVLVYLKKEKNYKIELNSLAYSVLKLVIYHPKMLLVANPTGAPELHRVIKYAYYLGIKVVSLISEGDVVDDPVRAQGFFWGWNCERKCYLDLFLLWSERSQKIFEKYIPESRMFSMKVSGATGFDRYKLFQDKFMTKEMFCAKYKREYKKIVGITSWGFSIWFADKTDNEKRQFYIKSCLKLREILKDMISELKDVLFVLRPHPGEISDENEFMELKTLENVIVINPKDETVSDTINVCDIWMAYDSTTCMEAWLLDKMTLLINPYPIEYSRSDISKGSPIMQNVQETIACIQEFYQKGKCEEFERLEENRKEIIKEVIGYSDGKNYIRAANEIIQVMNNHSKRNKKITFYFLYELTKDVFKYIWQHSFLKKIKDFEKEAPYDFILSQKEYDEEEQMYYSAIYGENV